MIVGCNLTDICALMHHIYRTGTDVRQRDLDQEEFLGREYSLDARGTYHNNDLEGRSIFSLFGVLGYVASVLSSIYSAHLTGTEFRSFGLPSIAKLPPPEKQLKRVVK